MTETISVLINLATRGQNEVKQAAQSLKEIDGAAKSGGASMKSMAMGIGAASAALAGMVVAGKQAWELLKDAAAIEFTQKKFDNLAASINSTGDALLGNLKAATGGMVSDLELMASASELVSLGLTKTEDETVRLASVAGQLNWNMQQVVLTMANMSTMRLDALGLSVEEVTGRAKELEAAGMAAQEAFKMAVIEAGEAKLEVIGLDEDSALGQIKQLESAWSNFVTGAKTAVLNVVIAGGGLDIIQQFNQDMGLADLKRRAAAAGVNAGDFIGASNGPRDISNITPQQLDALRQEVELAEKRNDAWVEFNNLRQQRRNDPVREMADYTDLAQQFFDATSGTRGGSFMFNPIEGWEDALAAYEERIANMPNVIRAAEDEAGLAFASWVDNPLQNASGQDFVDLLWEQALASGASQSALAELGIATGALTDEQIRAARVSMELNRQFESLALRQASGAISAEDYVEQMTELWSIAQDGNLGELIGQSAGTGYGPAVPANAQAMTEYMNQWREMEGLEVSPTIDVEGGMSEVNSIQSQLEAIDKINATPEVSIGGSWQSDINAIYAALAGVGSWSPGIPTAPVSQPDSDGQVPVRRNAGGGRDTAVIVNNYVDGYQVPRSSLDDITVDSIKGAMRRVGRT